MMIYPVGEQPIAFSHDSVWLLRPRNPRVNKEKNHNFIQFKKKVKERKKENHAMKIASFSGKLIELTLSLNIFLVACLFSLGK